MKASRSRGFLPGKSSVVSLVHHAYEAYQGPFRPVLVVLRSGLMDNLDLFRLSVRLPIDVCGQARRIPIPKILVERSSFALAEKLAQRIASSVKKDFRLGCAASTNLVIPRDAHSCYAEATLIFDAAIDPQLVIPIDNYLAQFWNELSLIAATNAPDRQLLVMSKLTRGVLKLMEASVSKTEDLHVVMRPPKRSKIDMVFPPAASYAVPTSNQVRAVVGCVDDEKRHAKLKIIDPDGGLIRWVQVEFDIDRRNELLLLQLHKRHAQFDLALIANAGGAQAQLIDFKECQLNLISP